jgi:hypothetical protein
MEQHLLQSRFKLLETGCVAHVEKVKSYLKQNTDGLARYEIYALAGMDFIEPELRG